ncbi:juvenile hormone acid O-methyltransferase [Ixodes scapularis]|uniref:juvenile hormone acid O-methyltransferase n=1 Tax=Ixodes scapularis TaxID=6945 RepID=UPI001A9E0346|nr:juvenile hormone acid O-methyltransferase [Ixodes scapularis]
MKRKVLKAVDYDKRVYFATKPGAQLKETMARAERDHRIWQAGTGMVVIHAGSMDMRGEVTAQSAINELEEQLKRCQMSPEHQYVNFHWKKTTSQVASSPSRNLLGPLIAEALEEPRPTATFLPEVYVMANDFQRALNIRMLERLGTSFKSRPNTGQQFMDIGCGTGDFTRQELLPRCQPCRRIIATDISESMVGYARENFAHPQIEYQVHDISKDVSGLVRKYGQFNRVYSFFALHWVKDHVTAFRNMSDLMTSGGECMLFFVARSTNFEMWRRICLMDQWKAYNEICEKFIPDRQDTEDHASLISYMLDILKTVNLKPHACEILTKTSLAEDLEEVIRTSIAVLPFLPLLPVESRASYKDDLENVIRSYWKESNGGDPHFYTDMFVVHAGKS